MLATALSWTGTALYLGGAVVLFTGVKERHIGWALYAVGGWIGLVSDVLIESPGMAAIDGVLAAFFTWMWWKNRPKGNWRKAARELGAKSRARVEALARQMTPSPIPTLVGGS